MYASNRLMKRQKALGLARTTIDLVSGNVLWWGAVMAERFDPQHRQTFDNSRGTVPLLYDRYDD